jgi:hypothetical protein
VLITWGLFRIGSRLKVPRALVALAVSLWILYDQALVGGEWMLGGFEAKTAAYAAIVFAIDAAMGDRLVLAAALAGLGLTFHPSVGVLCAGGLTTAVLGTRRSLRGLLVPVLVAAACSLPGLVQAVAMLGGGDPVSNTDWEFLAFTFMGIHLDPKSFEIGLVLTLLLCLAFTAWWARERPDLPGFRWLLWFQGFGLAVALIGAIAFIAGAYRVLTIMPFRLFPMFGLLVFFLSIGSFACSLRDRRWGPLPVVLLVATLLGFPGLFHQYRSQAFYMRKAWTAEPDDLSRAFAWVREHTAPDAVGVVPPWRGDAPLTMQRGQVVHWGMPRYDHLAEWRQRVEDSVGGLPGGAASVRTRDWGELWATMKQRYRDLPTEKVEGVARTYNATFFVAEREYPFPELHREGGARVYRVGGE